MTRLNPIRRSPVDTLRRPALLAATLIAAGLTLAGGSALAQASDDADSWTEYSYGALEVSHPDSHAVDGLLLDLPVDAFAAVSFPEMPDLEIAEPPVLLAGLDPMSTP